MVLFSILLTDIFRVGVYQLNETSRQTGGLLSTLFPNLSPIVGEIAIKQMGPKL